jgi:Multicopper oxidase
VTPVHAVTHVLELLGRIVPGTSSDSTTNRSMTHLRRSHLLLRTRGRPGPEDPGTRDFGPWVHAIQVPEDPSACSTTNGDHRVRPRRGDREALGWGAWVFALVAAAQPYLADTVTVAPGERYSVLVKPTPDQVGVWAFHCHILSHAERDDGMMFGMVTAFIVQ